jgi:hypothetical protein
LESSNGFAALPSLPSNIGRTAKESLYLPDLQVDMPIPIPISRIGEGVGATVWRKVN